MPDLDLDCIALTCCVAYSIVTSAPPELVTDIVATAERGGPPWSVGTIDVAVMMLVPGIVVARTRPELLTWATSMLELDQATAPVQSWFCSMITAPSWIEVGCSGAVPLGGVRPRVAEASSDQRFGAGQEKMPADVLASSIKQNCNARGPE